MKKLTIALFSFLIFLFSCLAGLIGALTGLGGGVVIIPALVLLFHIDIHLAMGASLISVMATSSGSGAANLRDGYSNLRVGIFLETVTVIGAFIGALLISVVSSQFLTIAFSLILFLSAYLSLKRKEEQEHHAQGHPWADKLRLHSSYPHKNQSIRYYVQNVPLALSVMGFAGVISGLLGIGSGALKVLAMDHALRLPYKVATTTSNFMIGITAAVSAGIYFAHGYINPLIAAPVMLGVLSGSFFGAKVLPLIHVTFLRIIFSIVICFIGLQLIYNALTGAT